jgi:hypothetical protein
MEDRTTSCTFEELMESVDPELRAIGMALREVITALHRDHVEIIWKNQRIASYGVGPKKMSEHYTYIGLHKKHVNLGFYHGASLADPKRLLEGTGKRLRHVKIKSVAQASSTQVKSLIAEAIAKLQGSLG